MRCHSEVPFSACTQWRDCASRGVGRVALHCKLQGDAVAGFLTDSVHCWPCSSPSLGEGSKHRPDTRPDELVLFIWPMCLFAWDCLSTASTRMHMIGFICSFIYLLFIFFDIFSAMEHFYIETPTKSVQNGHYLNYKITKHSHQVEGKPGLI